MKYRYQEKKDDCISACIATLLDRDDVPYFEPSKDPDNFWIRVRNWLFGNEYYLMCTYFDNIKNIEKAFKNDGYGIIGLCNKDRDRSHAFISKKWFDNP